MAILNLGKVIGPPGPQGEPGPQGIQGPPGPQGEPGSIDGIDEFLHGLTFGQNDEGKWGYIPPGADTVIPFSKGGEGGGSSIEVKDFPNPVTFHPTVVLFSVGAVEVERDIVVKSEWKKVDA